MEFIYLVNGNLYTFFPVYNTNIVKVKGSKNLTKVSFYDYVTIATHPDSKFIGVV